MQFADWTQFICCSLSWVGYVPQLFEYDILRGQESTNESEFQINPDSLLCPFLAVRFFPWNLHTSSLVTWIFEEWLTVLYRMEAIEHLARTFCYLSQFLRSWIASALMSCPSNVFLNIIFVFSLLMKVLTKIVSSSSSYELHFCSLFFP